MHWARCREDNRTLWVAEIVENLAWGVVIQTGQGDPDVSCVEVYLAVLASS